MQLASQEAEATDHSAHTEAHRLLPTEPAEPAGKAYNLEERYSCS